MRCNLEGVANAGSATLISFSNPHDCTTPFCLLYEYFCMGILVIKGTATLQVLHSLKFIALWFSPRYF